LRHASAGGRTLHVDRRILEPRHANRARGVILFAATVTAGISATANGAFLTGVLTALLGSLYVLLTALSRMPEENASPYQSAVTIGDLLLITALIWLTGGVHSEYYLLYYLPIIVAAVRQDTRVGMAACIGAIALYSFAAFSAPHAPSVLPFESFRVITVGLSALVLILFFSLLKRELKVSEDLRDTLHHSLRRVAAVYDVAHAANTGADLAGVLSVILDHAARATDAANGSVFLLLEDGQLKPTASLSAAPGTGETPSELALAPAREALDARAPITKTVEARQAGDKDASASIVYVPLLSLAGPIGVLSLVSRRGRRFARRQLDFLTSLCSEAALAIENAQLRSELRRLAITDHLTGLPNRREVESRLALELKRGARYGRPVSLLMIDVDDLKEVNDEFGHAAGDDVLCALARMMKESIRSSETAGRLGGDEFAIVLPETDARQAAALADRLIEGVSATVGAWPNLPDSDAIAATIGMSIGIADSRNGALPPKELMARADAALYEAKRLGKNRSWVNLDSPSATAFAIADSNPIP